MTSAEKLAMKITQILALKGDGEMQNFIVKAEETIICATFDELEAKGFNPKSHRPKNPQLNQENNHVNLSS